jgi:hypothetical protein
MQDEYLEFLAADQVACQAWLEPFRRKYGDLPEDELHRLAEKEMGDRPDPRETFTDEELRWREERGCQFFDEAE